MIAQLPPEFSSLWSVREDLFRVRVSTSVWREILLSDLDRPIVHGQIVQLVGKRIGPGVYEVTIEKDGKGQHS